VVTRDENEVSLHLYRSERVIGLCRNTKVLSRNPRVEKKSLGEV
jgi:hypothetical protein